MIRACVYVCVCFTGLVRSLQLGRWWGQDEAPPVVTPPLPHRLESTSAVASRQAHNDHLHHKIIRSLSSIGSSLINHPSTTATVCFFSLAVNTTWTMLTAIPERFMKVLIYMVFADALLYWACQVGFIYLCFLLL